jgi:folate-dependent phosphoribosylglycinamide formyltransferase PurN
MRYTLILELPDGRTETKSINSFFIAFHYIKNGLSRIKKNKEILTIIDESKNEIIVLNGNSKFVNTDILKQIKKKFNN